MIPCIRQDRLGFYSGNKESTFQGLTQREVISQSCYMSQVTWQGSTLQSQSKVQDDKGHCDICFYKTHKSGKGLCILPSKVSSRVKIMAYAYTSGTIVTTRLEQENVNVSVWKDESWTYLVNNTNDYHTFLKSNLKKFSTQSTGFQNHLGTGGRLHYSVLNHVFQVPVRELYFPLPWTSRTAI